MQFSYFQRRARSYVKSLNVPLICIKIYKHKSSLGLTVAPQFFKSIGNQTANHLQQSVVIEIKFCAEIPDVIRQFSQIESLGFYLRHSDLGARRPPQSVTQQQAQDCRPSEQSPDNRGTDGASLQIHKRLSLSTPSGEGRGIHGGRRTGKLTAMNNQEFSNRNEHSSKPLRTW